MPVPAQRRPAEAHGRGARPVFLSEGEEPRPWSRGPEDGKKTCCRILVLGVRRRTKKNTGSGDEVRSKHSREDMLPHLGFRFLVCQRRIDMIEAYGDLVGSRAGSSRLEGLLLGIEVDQIERQSGV